MFNKILLGVFAMLVASAAQAQEYGFLLGVHETGASTTLPAYSVSSGFNFKTGLLIGFELAPNVRFRTGALYNQRHFETTVSVLAQPSYTAKFNMDYIDVPANFQYNFNEMVGVFAGMVVGVNINDQVMVPSGQGPSTANADGLIPLVDAGFNFLFDDMIGFDLYYERGVGKFADYMQNYNTFGANFIYWF